jgi:mannose-6-phosphate isomerase-like protein (cupin superfamily)
MDEHTQQQSPDAEPARGVRPVDLRDYVDVDADTARRVRVLTGSHLALDVWCLLPRQSSGVLHDPERDLVYTVIGGRSWFVTDEGEIGLDPMGAMLVPADTVHGIDNRGADPLIIVAVTAPPSDEPEQAAVELRQAAIHREDGRPNVLRRAVEGLLGTSRDQR